jgi:hypothetical protein
MDGIRQGESHLWLLWRKLENLDCKPICWNSNKYLAYCVCALMFKPTSEKIDIVPIRTILLVGVMVEDCSPFNCIYIHQPPMTCTLELLYGKSLYA